MSRSLKRLIGDLTGTWSTTPPAQALRWYALLLAHAPTVLRTRKFYSVDAGMHGLCRFQLFGKTLTFDADAINSSVVDPLQGNAYAFLREFFIRRIYFRAFTNPSFETCLDLGCNIGIVASVLRQLGGPRGRVIAVDPLTYPGNTFREKAAQIPGLIFDQRVLCDAGTLHDPARLHALCDPYNFDPRTAATIAQVMAAHDVTRVNFVKMDIEGAEFNIFAEPTPWLNQVDNIAMEVHSECGDPGMIVDRLQQHAFAVSWSDDHGYPVDTRHAGYIYASRTGNLRV